MIKDNEIVIPEELKANMIILNKAISIEQKKLQIPYRNGARGICF
ncbi:hypothetical protein [Sporosarcina psychrophila]|nr:hypothetical protein [Sporosarcina psychrophila]